MTKKVIRKTDDIDRWKLDGMKLSDLATTVQGWIEQNGPDAKIDICVGEYELDMTIESQREETDTEYAHRLAAEAAALVRQQEAKERGERAMLAQLKAKYDGKP